MIKSDRGNLPLSLFLKMRIELPCYRETKNKKNNGGI